MLLLIQGNARPVPQEDQPEGNGTGFVWDADGNIVTNFHVLASALVAITRRPGGPPREGGPRPVVAKITFLGAGNPSILYRMTSLQSLQSSAYQR